MRWRGVEIRALLDADLVAACVEAEGEFHDAWNDEALTPSLQNRFIAVLCLKAERARRETSPSDQARSGPPKAEAA